MNCSMEIDLSKELSAPANHSVYQQIEAETNVRDVCLDFSLIIRSHGFYEL